MKRVALTAAAAAVAAVMLAGCKAEQAGKQVKEPSRPGIYEDRKRGFSIKSISGWAVNEDAAPALVSIECEDCDSGFPATVNVAAEELKDPMTPEEYASRALPLATKVAANVEVVARKDVDHPAGRAHEVVSKVSGGGRDVKCVQTFIVVDNQAFVLTQTALPSEFDNLADQMAKIVRSFRVRRTGTLAPPQTE